MEQDITKPDLYPVKGQYAPNEPVTLILDLPPQYADAVQVSCRHLEKCVFEASYPISGAVTEITLPGFSQEFLGLGIHAVLIKDCALQTTLFTAADVSKPGHVVRYGFLSSFDQGDMEDRDIAAMAKYHINLVQFYDWSYRHDHLVAEADDYRDMMGKRNFLPCVRYKIDACHRRGMGAMAYGAVYAASRPFWEAHKDWSLYALPEKPLVFINTFYFMNIDRACPWHDHIIQQYREAISKVGFDGIHMDTYGYPKSALNASGEVCDLSEHLPRLINDTNEYLASCGLKPRLIFNNVGAWPVEATTQTHQDAVYMEVWPPYERLHHLKELILKALPAGKPVVLAAYIAPFRLESEERALYCALINSFAINASGATQLFLGEEDAVLTQGYYADHSILTPWQNRRIRDYQDFFVRYQELLFDSELRDVTMTHCCWDNMEYLCDKPFSAYGEPDKLWLILRESTNTKLVAMVNLCGNSEDYWNRGKEKPKTLYGITFHISVIGSVQNVFYATPDDNGGNTVSLPFSLEETDRGHVIAVTVPTLEIGGLLWFHVNNTDIKQSPRIL
jgi:dextranase